MNIDPNILSIILGLITNGLTSLIVVSGEKTKDILIGKEFLNKWEQEKTSILPILKQAISDVAKNVQWNEAQGEEVISLFLLSPEAEEIVRQLYSTQFLNDQFIDNTQSLRKIFLSLFTNFITSYPSEVTPAQDKLADTANLLLNALIMGCNIASRHAIDQGNLAAHEAQSAFRHNLIESEIKAIQRKLDFFTSQQTINIPAILEFEKKYRYQLSERHGYITPPNFDSAHKIPINNLYVSPDFAAIHKKQANKHTLKLDTLLSSIYRAVLLGTPGGGKSTLTLKLCFELSKHYSQRLFAGRKELTPILVVLRNYGVEKKERRCSIMEFVETEVEATYQLPSPPKGTFEYLLLNGRVVVIFDGLDELLDTSYRQEIRDDVQSFCSLYPSVPILVTSREVGYEQAPLDKNMFSVFRLEPFKSEQVKEYVQKWFKVANINAPSRLSQQQMDAFFEESKSVEDLRSNPLMLALMCNIYRGENYIPRNRPDVYDKCATMLFERWDRSRNIRTLLPFEAHIRPTMMYLAHWIYTSEGLRRGVTERKLVAKASEYLHSKRFEDFDEAERAAWEFIEFCRGRAWVFTETGTERGGERLYQFVHQTFLEYFTAAYIVRTHPTSESLTTYIFPRIARREWDVVAQLAFQIQNRHSENAGDELLTQLLTYANKAEEEEWWNIMSFAARCLTFIVPTPKVTREVTKTIIWKLIVRGSRFLKGIKIKEEIYDMRPGELLQELQNSAEENAHVIINSMENLIIEIIKKEDTFTSSIALELCDYLPSSFTIKNNERWEHVKERIWSTFSERLEVFYSKNLYLCIGGIWSERVSLENLAKWHGIDKLFIDTVCSVVPNFRITSVIFGIIRHIFDMSLDINDPWITRDLHLLKDIGIFFLNYAFLLDEKQYQVNFDFRGNYFYENAFLPSHDTKIKLNVNEMFGLFVILAILSETESIVHQKIVDAFIESSEEWNIFIGIKQVLKARKKRIWSEIIQELLIDQHFSQQQCDFMCKWARIEIDLVLGNDIRQLNE